MWMVIAGHDVKLFTREMIWISTEAFWETVRKRWSTEKMKYMLEMTSQPPIEI